jgi:hypothetical protein
VLLGAPASKVEESSTVNMEAGYNISEEHVSTFFKEEDPSTLKI